MFCEGSEQPEVIAERAIDCDLKPRYSHRLTAKQASTSHAWKVMDDTASLKSTAALLPQQRGSSLDNSTAYNLMRIPIRAAILDDRDTTHPDVPNPLRESPKKPKQAFFKRGLSINRPDEDMRIVTMTREDYQQYWAKAPDGSLAPSVKEPEEGRT